MLEQLETTILSGLQVIFDQLGWLGVILLMIFENATGITPSEIILGFAGWMLIQAHNLHPSMILLGGLYAALGSVIGSSIAYWVARIGGRPVIDRITDLFRINPAHITRTEQKLQRWGVGLVFAGRVIPGVRTLISLPVGMARMPFGLFAIATFLGSYIWCTLLIGIGYQLGIEWPLISTYIWQYFPYLLAAGIGLVLFFSAFKNHKGWRILKQGNQA